MGLLNVCFVAAASAQNWGGFGSQSNSWNPFDSRSSRSQSGRFNPFAPQQNEPTNAVTFMYPSSQPEQQQKNIVNWDCNQYPWVPACKTQAAAPAPAPAEPLYTQPTRPYPSPYPTPTWPPASFNVAPAQAPIGTAVGVDPFVAALARMGFSAAGVFVGAVSDPKPALIAAVPATSPSSEPMAFTEPKAYAALVAAQQKAADDAIAAQAAFVAAQQAKAAAVQVPEPAAAGGNFNSLYAQMDGSQVKKTTRPNQRRPPTSFAGNQIYAQLDQSSRADPSIDYEDLEGRYGKQLRADDNAGPASGNDFVTKDGKTFLKNKLQSMDKSGPKIEGGKFKRTPPSETFGELTGRPVVSYDFHGVIQHCRSKTEACRVNEKVVQRLEKDAINNDIIITTAGVPEGNAEMIEYLTKEANIGHLIKRLYNSGSKWEVMVDLGVIAHYDDLPENNDRINSRASGIKLYGVNAQNQNIRCVFNCNIQGI